MRKSKKLMIFNITLAILFVAVLVVGKSTWGFETGKMVSKKEIITDEKVLTETAEATRSYSYVDDALRIEYLKEYIHEPAGNLQIVEVFEEEEEEESVEDNRLDLFEDGWMEAEKVEWMPMQQTPTYQASHTNQGQGGGRGPVTKEGVKAPEKTGSNGTEKNTSAKDGTGKKDGSENPTPSNPEKMEPHEDWDDQQGISEDPPSSENEDVSKEENDDPSN